MEALDSKGQAIVKGDKILVPAIVQDVVDVNGEAMLSALTELPHGTEGKVYSIPVIHGSQVTKA